MVRINDKLKEQINKHLLKGKGVIIQTNEGLVIEPKTSADKLVVIPPRRRGGQ